VFPIPRPDGFLQRRGVSGSSARVANRFDARRPPGWSRRNGHSRAGRGAGTVAKALVPPDSGVE